jgi:hypothetical protein
MPEITIFQQYIPAGYQNVTGFLKFTTLLSDLKLIPHVDDCLCGYTGKIERTNLDIIY